MLSPMARKLLEGEIDVNSLQIGSGNGERPCADAVARRCVGRTASNETTLNEGERRKVREEYLGASVVFVEEEKQQQRRREGSRKKVKSRWKGSGEGGWQRLLFPGETRSSRTCPSSVSVGVEMMTTPTTTL